MNALDRLKSALQTGSQLACALQALEEIAELPDSRSDEASSIAKAALTDLVFREPARATYCPNERCVLPAGHETDCAVGVTRPRGRIAYGEWHYVKMREGAVCLLPVSHQGACVLTP